MSYLNCGAIRGVGFDIFVLFSLGFFVCVVIILVVSVFIDIFMKGMGILCFPAQEHNRLTSMSFLAS